MLLRHFVDEARDKIADLLYYQDVADEIHAIVGEVLVSHLRNTLDELDILAHDLDFE